MHGTTSEKNNAERQETLNFTFNQKAISKAEKFREFGNRMFPLECQILRFKETSRERKFMTFLDICLQDVFQIW